MVSMIYAIYRQLVNQIANLSTKGLRLVNNINFCNCILSSVDNTDFSIAILPSFYTIYRQSGNAKHHITDKW